MITDVDDTRLGDSSISATRPRVGVANETRPSWPRASPPWPGWWSRVTRSGRCSPFRRTEPEVAGLLAGRPDVAVLVATPEVVARTVGFDLHRGVVASATRRPLPRVDAVLESSRRIAVLEGLNDPENLGLIARSARAFGIDALVLDPTCIDPYYRRTVRVSMGEVLLLTVARFAQWPAGVDMLRDHGFETWAFTPAADAADLWTCVRPPKVALLFGAEGPGLRAGTLRRATRRVRIPIDPAVDSINVGHAAAVAFAAVAR